MNNNKYDDTDVEFQLQLAAKAIKKASEALHRSVTISNLYHFWKDPDASDLSTTTCYIVVDEQKLYMNGVKSIGHPRSAEAEGIENIKGLVGRVEFLEETKLEDI